MRARARISHQFAKIDFRNGILFNSSNQEHKMHTKNPDLSVRRAASKTRRSNIKLLLAAAVVCLLPLPTRATDKKMDEQAFWKIVEAVKASTGSDFDARPHALEIALTPLDLESLQAFQRTYESLLVRANRWDLWGAAYLMNGGCSDDGFKYFRDWLISEGQHTYEKALAEPDSLSAIPKRDYFDLELYGYAASKVYAQKGGGELERDFLQVELAAPEGREWQEPELPAMFPKLAAKYRPR
jgi:hypothetical protein